MIIVGYRKLHEIWNAVIRSDKERLGMSVGKFRWTWRYVGPGRQRQYPYGSHLRMVSHFIKSKNKCRHTLAFSLLNSGHRNREIARSGSAMPGRNTGRGVPFGFRLQKTATVVCLVLLGAGYLYPVQGQIGQSKHNLRNRRIGAGIRMSLSKNIK